MTDHVIICGWGRVGRACADYLRATGRQVVVVDRDSGRLEGIEYPSVHGDVTDDAVLGSAGIARAHALVAALDTDADNVYVTLSSRALRPDLVIIARARNEASKSKLVRAGADRAVNPQLIGGRRMAAFALQPHVAEFLDVVMHDESLDYRMEQVEVDARSRLAGCALHDAALGENTGVLLLAVRDGADASFVANPPPTARLEAGAILIAVGTASQLDALRAQASGG
jgi:voltage-gated potassium channel